MESITKENSFVKGAVRYPDLGYVVCSKDRLAADKEAHSIFVAWDRGQFGDIETKSWYTAGICIIEDQSEHMLAVGEYGDVVVFGSGEHYEEIVDLSQSGPKSKGPLRGVRAIGNKAYVVGMQRQIYRRNGRDSWINLAKDITPGKDDPIVGFESIDGFSEDNIYAVGWQGEIYHYNGGQWRENVGITNLILTDVCCAENGFVYICGQVGTLLKGKDGQWEIIELGEFNQDIWSVSWFKGKLYFTTMQNVFFLDADNNIDVVIMGSENINSSYQLSVRGNVMWSIGAKDLMAFDGVKWSRIG